MTASGTLSVDGGSASQTTDARTPRAGIDASSLTIRNADGSLTIDAAQLQAEAHGACDSSRAPAFGATSKVGSVTLDGRPIDTSRDYSEPGVGANGAPLLGRLTIRFGETTRSANGILRRALRVIVTDRNGTVVFDAAGGEVAVGADGAVCAPPPVCPPGTQPQDGRCVNVEVAPLPPPPAPVAPGAPGTPAPGGPGRNRAPHRKRRGCADAGARVGKVSDRRLAVATLCLMNAMRTKRRLGKLRLSRDLSVAAARHARAMIAGRYFAHDEPAGPSFLDRVLRSGYLGRYGTWRVGENLGWGWGSGGTPRALLSAWMRSAPHRRNILNPRFRDVGIAVRAGSPRRGRHSRPVTYVIDFGGFLSQGRHAGRGRGRAHR